MDASENNKLTSTNFSLNHADLTEKQKQLIVNSNIPKQPLYWFCNIYLRELGQANTQSHRIETGDALPIRQQFYRQSPQSYAEMNRQLQEC